MNAVIGKITSSMDSILAGDHHIVTGGSLAAALADLKAGVALKEVTAGGGVYTPVAGGGDEASACAILCEDVADTDETDVEAVVVHGSVRREKITIADGSDATAAVFAGLRANGVYAV